MTCIQTSEQLDYYDRENYFLSFSDGNRKSILCKKHAPNIHRDSLFKKLLTQPQKKTKTKAG